MDFKFTLNSKKKFDCPSCGAHGRFVRYIDITTGKYHNDEKYGKCDRIESCGYHQIPPAEFVGETETRIIDEEEKNLFESDDFPMPVFISYRENREKIPNIFLRGIAKKFGIEAAVNAYNLYQLGTFEGGEVIFPYFFNSKLKSGKIMSYNLDLHRNKDKYPIWLHNFGCSGYKLPDDKKLVESVDPELFKFVMPLFGWDLIKTFPFKKICLVESEKTAVIASILFPEFNWLATGGLYCLQSYKFPYNSCRIWRVFPDLGYLLYKNEKIKVSDYWKLRMNEINYSFTIIDEYPDFIPHDYGKKEIEMVEEMQFDLADFILMKKNNSIYLNELKKELYL